jgi:hypothetical protein
MSGTCIYVRLLGPCFKTGREKPCFHQAHLIQSRNESLHHQMSCSVQTQVSIQAAHTPSGEQPALQEFPHIKTCDD